MKMAYIDAAHHSAGQRQRDHIITNRKRKKEKTTHRKVQTRYVYVEQHRKIERKKKSGKRRTTHRPAREEKVSRARSFDYTAAKALLSSAVATAAAAAVAPHNIIFHEPKSVQAAISLASSICYLVAVASNSRCGCEQTGCPHRNYNQTEEKKRNKYLRRYIALACVL